MKRVLLALAVVGVSLAFAGAGRGDNPYLPDMHAVLGPYNVLVILATWGPQPFTPAQVQDVVFDESGSFFASQSYGKLWLTGTVTPWLHAFDGTVDCSETTVSRGGRAAATRAGFAPAAYDSIIYVLPPNSCPWSGVTFGDEVWLNGLLSRKLVAHELGHTMGLQHANTTLCSAQACSAVEYGDPYDTMGGGDSDFSAWNKFELGWLTNVGRTEANGTYTLDPLEKNSTGAQALVITTAKTQYWLEDRVDPGHSDQGNTYDPGVLVHVTPSPDLRGLPVSLLRNSLLVDPASRGRPEMHSGDRFSVAGAFTLTVTRLPAGGAAQIDFNWTDKTSPAAPKIAYVSRTEFGDLGVSFSPSREEGSGVVSYRATLDGKRTVGVDGEADDLTAVFTGVRPGKHTVRVIAVDRAGNTSRAATRTFRLR